MKHIIILLLLCFTVIGCNSPNPFGTVYVSGTVLLDGNPVQGISVSFNPIGGDISAGGLTDGTGKIYAHNRRSIGRKRCHSGRI